MQTILTGDIQSGFCPARSGRILGHTGVLALVLEFSSRDCQPLDLVNGLDLDR